MERYVSDVRIAVAELEQHKAQRIMVPEPTLPKPSVGIRSGKP